MGDRAGEVTGALVAIGEGQQGPDRVLLGVAALAGQLEGAREQDIGPRLGLEVAGVVRVACPLGQLDRQLGGLAGDRRPGVLGRAAALEEAEQRRPVTDRAHDLLVEREQLGVIGRHGQRLAKDRLGDGVLRVLLERAAHAGDPEVTRLGVGQADLAEPEHRLRADLRGHLVVGGGRDALEQLDLPGRVAARRGDPGHAHPRLDDPVTERLGAREQLLGFREVAELALGDRRAADQQVGGEAGLLLAPDAVDHRHHGVDIAAALAQVRRPLGDRAVQLGVARRVLQRLQAQLEGVARLVGGVERVPQLGEDLRPQLALGAVRQARAEHTDQQGRVGVLAERALQLRGLAVVLQRRLGRGLEQLGGLTALVALGRQTGQLVHRLGDPECVAGDRRLPAGCQQQRAVRALGPTHVALFLGELGEHLQGGDVAHVHVGGQLELRERLDAIALGAGERGELGVHGGAVGRAAAAELGE